MARQYERSIVFFNAKAANGTSPAVEVSPFRNCVVAISTASSGALTVKCQGAIGETAPNFTASATQSNQWENIQLIALVDASTLAGGTGFVVSGSDATHLYEVNINCLDWLAFTVSGYSAGSVSVTMTVADNL